MAFQGMAFQGMAFQGMAMDPRLAQVTQGAGQSRMHQGMAMDPRLAQVTQGVGQSGRRRGGRRNAICLSPPAALRHKALFELQASGSQGQGTVRRSPALAALEIMPEAPRRRRSSTSSSAFRGEAKQGGAEGKAAEEVVQATLSFDPRDAFGSESKELEFVAVLLQAGGVPQVAAALLAKRAREVYASPASLVEGEEQPPPPYHSWFHAVDVLQAATVLLTGAPAELQPLDRMAVALGALFHDAGHPGRSNAFLRATASPLVSKFGEPSTLERLHWSLAESCLCHVEVQREMLSALSREDWAALLARIKGLICATDMALHAETLKDLEQGKRDAATLAKAILKGADISNVARPLATARRWADSLRDEFLAQGDDERARGLDVTPMCDRAKFRSTVHMSCGFIDAVALPYFHTLRLVIPAAGAFATAVEANRALWEREMQQQQATKNKHKRRGEQ
mmetsp:Transcript_26295/g.76672  ORF Transcript_26295/g.76672 Transcript_26295/m.76672 type:complete len:454 (-) Transcript_26295:74-1435(-)